MLSLIIIAKRPLKQSGSITLTEVKLKAHGTLDNYFAANFSNVNSPSYQSGCLVLSYEEPPSWETEVSKLQQKT